MADKHAINARRSKIRNAPDVRHESVIIIGIVNVLRGEEKCRLGLGQETRSGRRVVR